MTLSHKFLNRRPQEYVFIGELSDIFVPDMIIHKDGCQEQLQVNQFNYYEDIRD